MCLVFLWHLCRLGGFLGLAMQGLFGFNGGVPRPTAPSPVAPSPFPSPASLSPASLSTQATPASVTANLSHESRGVKQARKLLANHPDMVGETFPPNLNPNHIVLPPPQQPTPPPTVQPTPPPTIQPNPPPTIQPNPIQPNPPRFRPANVPPNQLVVPNQPQPPQIQPPPQVHDELSQLKKAARNLDRNYAQYVCGNGLSNRSLASVWGPRNGSGLNAVDTRRLQEDVYRYIIREVDESMAALEDDPQVPLPTIPGAMTTVPPNPTPAPQTTQPPLRQTARKRIKKLARDARELREAFNEGWEDEADTGILNDVVSSEFEVYHMLKNTGAISTWDRVLCHDDVMLRIRLLRRFQRVQACFATSVSAAMLANSMMRPTTRPTRYIMQQTHANAAMHFQMLYNCVWEARGDLLDLVRDYNQRVKKGETPSVLFLDYHSI